MARTRTSTNRLSRPTDSHSRNGHRLTSLVTLGIVALIATVAIVYGRSFTTEVTPERLRIRTEPALPSSLQPHSESAELSTTGAPSSDAGIPTAHTLGAASPAPAL